MGLPECLAGKDGKDALEARLYMTADKDDYCLLDMEYLPNKGMYFRFNCMYFIKGVKYVT